MRIRRQSFVLVLAVLVAISLTGCSSSARSALGDGPDYASLAPKPIAQPGLAVAMVKTEGGVSELPCAPAPQPVYYSQNPCAPTCAPVCEPICGLPCETGCGNWHVRALAGWPFFTGDDTTIEGCYYFGVDVGRTFPCCWGVDVFARAFGGEADRTVAIPGAADFSGTDVGEFYTLGVKATWQNSISNSRFYYYVGVGPEVYWTRNYLIEEEGIGGFAEIGLGYVLNKNWRFRAGLDVHALDTKAAQENAANDDSSRLLWVFAPVVGVEFTF